MQGYNQRDNENSARRNAILRRMKGQAGGNPMNPGIQNYQNGL
jgi:hypothetical protein